MRYALRTFTDGAIPVYVVIDPDSGHPLTNNAMMLWQSISPDVLRCIMRSIAPDAVEVPLKDESPASTGLR